MAKRGRPARGEEGERKERILKAADALFCERGLSGVSVRDVAAKAEVNKSLVFYYFDNKQVLFEAVLEEGQSLTIPGDDAHGDHPAEWAVYYRTEGDALASGGVSLEQDGVLFGTESAQVDARRGRCYLAVVYGGPKPPQAGG